MLKGIFDTHAHYDEQVFAGRLDGVLADQLEQGVELIVNSGSDEASSLRSLELARRYSFIYASVGVHPHEAEKLTDGWLERLEEMCADPRAVAIGEIGLDYFYDYSDRKIQREVFCRQLELAARLDLPVVIHDRDAHGDTLAILREYRPKGALHRYSGSVETAAELTALGMHLGFGCAVTYKNAQKERDCARLVPAGQLLLETDCPFLAPAHIRRETSVSSMISFAAEVIADQRKTTAQEVIDLANANGRRLFGI